jgi:hypothetical protein
MADQGLPQEPKQSAFCRSYPLPLVVLEEPRQQDMLLLNFLPQASLPQAH